MTSRRSSTDPDVAVEVLWSFLVSPSPSRSCSSTNADGIPTSTVGRRRVRCADDGSDDDAGSSTKRKNGVNALRPSCNEKTRTFLLYWHRAGSSEKSASRVGLGLSSSLTCKCACSDHSNIHKMSFDVGAHSAHACTTYRLTQDVQRFVRKLKIGRYRPSYCQLTPPQARTVANIRINLKLVW